MNFIRPLELVFPFPRSPLQQFSLFSSDEYPFFSPPFLPSWNAPTPRLCLTTFAFFVWLGLLPGPAFPCQAQTPPPPSCGLNIYLLFHRRVSREKSYQGYLRPICSTTTHPPSIPTIGDFTEFRAHFFFFFFGTTTLNLVASIFSRH